MKKLVILILVSCSIKLSAQQPDAEGSLVKWMSLEEALKKNETEPKPILVDFYTTWCGWCKVMMKSTYADPALAQYINTYFYAAKFDAEGKDTIEYLGKRYGPSSLAPKATHTLAMKLMPGQQMYPTTLFLNAYNKEKKEFELSMLASGYLDQRKIEPLLVYNVENVYRSASYDDFGPRFKETFYDSLPPAAKPVWTPAKEVFRDSVVRKKKTMVLIGTEWCNSCRVMRRTTFSDSLVADYLAEKFDLVELNAETTDTLFFKGKNYYKGPKEATPFHLLALALCRNQLILPTLTILDENMNPIDAIPYYLYPSFLDKVAHFFGDDIYKTKNWQAYMTELKEKSASSPVTK